MRAISDPRIRWIALGHGGYRYVRINRSCTNYGFVDQARHGQGSGAGVDQIKMFLLDATALMTGSPVLVSEDPEIPKNAWQVVAATAHRRQLSGHPATSFAEHSGV
jgi:hypothetical protein